MVFDLLRQEHIEILSEKVYPFVPSGSSANVVIYFTPKKKEKNYNINWILCWSISMDGR